MANAVAVIAKVCNIVYIYCTYHNLEYLSAISLYSGHSENIYKSKAT